MASLSRSNNFFNTLAASGPDAISSLFKVTITGGGLTDNESQEATIRCSGFTQPSLTNGTYEVKYIAGATITRPNAKIVGQKTFALTFRVDAYYSIYKAFLRNQKKFSNITKNAYNFDVNEASTYNIKVDALSEVNEEPIHLFEFKKVWVDSITPVAYASESSGPAQVTVNFKFIDYADMQVLK